MSDRTFPPRHHVLRDLDFDVHAVAAERHLATFSPGEGARTELGGVLTVVDLLAGTVCLNSIAPDWMATSGLTFHLRRPVPPGDLELCARVLRAGRTTVAVAVDARSVGEDLAFGEGVVTFSRLTRRESNLSFEGASFEPGSRFSFPSEQGTRIGTDGSLRQAIDCRVLDAANGVTETAIDGYVRNSFGVINGGAVSTIVEVSALSVVASESAVTEGAAPYVTDVVIHYLAQGRTGPVRTAASVLRGDPRSPAAAAASSVRVEVHDAGHPGGERLMVLAHVGVGRR